MRPTTYPTAQRGELVLAAFDEAATLRLDPTHVAILATEAVARILRGQPGIAWRVCAAEQAMSQEGERAPRMGVVVPFC